MSPVSPSAGPPGLTVRYRARPGFAMTVDRGIEAAEVARALYRYVPAAPVVLAGARSGTDDDDTDGPIVIRFAPPPADAEPVAFCHFAGSAREIRTRLGVAPLALAAAFALGVGLHVDRVRPVGEEYRTFRLVLPHVVRDWT